MAETRPAICRFCGFLCGVLVDVQDRRAVKVTGDPDNPMYQGYCCAKGRALPQLLAHPERLLRPAFCLRAGKRFDADAPILPTAVMAEAA